MRIASNERRADARRRIGTGAAPGALATIPAVQGSGEAAWSKNRRAEISYR